jgi:hypothetical protein
VLPSGREVKPAPADTRPDQAERVADYLEAHPGATLPEIDSACDLGCASKVLSDMADPDKLAYGIAKGWRYVPSTCGKAPRRRRTYTLLHRPTLARQIPLSLDL